MPAAVRSLARTAEDAAAFASVIGFPVAAKLASTRVQHKTDLGAVRLNLMAQQDVREAFVEIVARSAKAVGADAIDGVVIQPMISGGVETIVGIAHDPVFGPLVAFGSGGVNVEVFGDVRFRIAPLTDRDADDLLHEIRGLPLLKGFRGHAPADMEALRDVLLRVSRLAEEVPEISELDLNPVIALDAGNGCRIVDARIRVKRPGELSTAPRERSDRSQQMRDADASKPNN
jgi:acyl-CoA synthetase (NDP forming)